MRLFIIIFFIVAIGFYVYTKYLRLEKENIKEEKEAFENELSLTPLNKLSKYHNITLKFKNATEAKNLITRNNPYLLAMNQPNLIARNCVSIDELYNKYLNAFDDISESERDTVIKFVLELMDELRGKPAYYNYVKYWIGKMEIAKAKSWLEGGMPHTLDNTIIMDAGWFKNPRKSTLIHELTHIHQRNVPFEFEDLYRQLGYIEFDVSRIKSMGSVIILNRNNPDGLSPNWIWYSSPDNTYWWIGAIFNNITPNNLQDVSNLAFKLNADRDGLFYYLKQHPTPLDNLDTFSRYFGSNNPNNYHPNEMIAKFGEWYLEDILGVVNNISNSKEHYEGYKIYKNYFTNLTNTFYP